MPNQIARAKYLQRLIKDMGRNPREVALKIGNNPTLVYDIINGKTASPRIQTWEKIAAELRVPVEHLLGAETPKTEIIPEVSRLLRQLDPEAQARLVPHLRGLLLDEKSEPRE